MRVSQRPIKERDVERYLVARVKMLGGEVRKVKWIGRRGAPDRLVMLPVDDWGRNPTIWIEVKAPGEKAKPHQVREHDRMRAMGQVVFVVDSFTAVDKVLR